MDREALLKASERAAAFLEDQFESDGQLKDASVRGDLAAQYKTPTLFLLTGRTRLAHKLLDNLKSTFMQTNGDFQSFPSKTGAERKTGDGALCLFWPYINGWITMAAQRLGRFDISVPARQFLERFYNGSLKGYGVSLEDVEAGRPLDVCIMLSAHLGLLSLYCGDVKRAQEVGECIEQFVTLQDLSGANFYLRRSGSTGQLVTTFPDDQAPFFSVSRTAENQLHFMLGYPVIFLYFLHQASGQARHLDVAQMIIDFQQNCHPSLYSFFLCHKAAMGAGLISTLRSKPGNAEMAEKIVSYLRSLQTSEGDFNKDLPLLARLDQTAEIAVWFREFVDRVC